MFLPLFFVCSLHKNIIIDSAAALYDEQFPYCYLYDSVLLAVQAHQREWKLTRPSLYTGIAIICQPTEVLTNSGASVPRL